MPRCLTLCLFLLLLGPAVPGSGRELAALREVFSSHGTTFVDLRVRASQVTVPLRDYGDGAVFVYTGRVYFYEGVASLPGPVIHVKPGGKLVLRLLNDLGKQMYAHSAEQLYNFHGVNSTNVHFHGVHGDPHVDDVFKAAAPGQFMKYELNIPKKHLPGLHWYHTHSHGSSYLLLMGGLFGAFIVDSAKHDTLASLHSFVLMIHLYRLGISKLCDGMTMESVDTAIGTNMSSRPRIVSKSGKELPLPPDLFLVNGQHKPTIMVKRGEPTLLRLAFAAGSCYLNISFPKECRFYVAAIDGVPLKCTREVKGNWLYFTTATRYDVVTICGRDGEGKLPVMLARLGEPIFYIGLSPILPKRERRRSHCCHPEELTFPLCFRSRDAAYLTAGKPTFRRDISFSQSWIPDPKPYYGIGYGTDCSPRANSTTCFREHFSGRKGEVLENYHGFVVPLGATVEARVFGDPTNSTPHPLHLHVNHFVFVGFTPRKGGQHENFSMADFGVFPGDMRDTIPILDGQTIIRWRAATFTGEVVYHCHTLTHEDRGMMTSYLVYSSAVGRAGEEPNVAVDESVAKRNAARRLFLVPAIVLFLCALLCALCGWLRANPPQPGKWARKCKDLLLHRCDEVNQAELQPLRASDCS
ncbi:hypothetical protein TraAM80_09710 [Trypanosoma rangeli]|uniref:Multicopper oxidase n=1 Tax=Trypanosoma rangeli TaxID=5698 RepID=A0A3R7JTK5_TRYRA|nr:uncharacterized protein TraAM80_09710 [Trypanosoma rangeli]RNE96627.1 hypothetical protein TraAM80_09710 [Trypanosoma rangeli]|eukprot:RNE96627.1 hypothetical protein TraAM80_09710 [Trypanosoma rangeli]